MSWISWIKNTKTRSYTRILFLIFFIIFLIITILFLYEDKDIFKFIFQQSNWTNNVDTGTITPDFDVNKFKSKTLIENQEWYSDLNIKNFPKIKINNNISGIHLIAEVTFTDDFVRKYRYEDSEWYFFALNFFIGSVENGWFYNVYRDQYWWVKNSEKHWLTWAVLAKKINETTIRDIPLNSKVPVAVESKNWTPAYQFKYLDIEKYLSENLWKELPIWVYLSSVKEVKWYELTRIVSLKLIYLWDESDVEVIN